MKMNKKGFTAALLAGVLMLSGCAQKETSETADDAKPVILAVSFGTSYNDTRDKTIGAIENAIAEANGDYEVRRAFTSQIIIDILAERDGLQIDNIEEALDRLVEDGIKSFVVQPTHIMSGYEYDDVIAALDEYKDKFDTISVGAPLLTSDDDYSKVADALIADTADYDDGSTAIVFMGHGTEHDANTAYAKLQEVLTSKGAENIFVGTVEATPSLDDMVDAVKEGEYTKVVLQPLMVVAGDHANNDMAGDEEGSWKTTFEAEGYEVECILKGLGEIEAIRDIYVAHVNDAING